MADSLILMVLALVVFGPRRLPLIGRQIGKLMYEFRKASNDFKFQMEEELRHAEDADRRQKEEERLKAIPAAPKLSAPEAMAGLVSAESAEGAIAETVTEVPTEPSAEEASPRILPPSSGEQVAAARPNRLTALSRQAQDQADAQEPAGELTAEPEAADAAPTGKPAEAEQAAHHA
jgi:sec-independent protein translocase protein TatB